MDDEILGIVIFVAGMCATAVIIRFAGLHKFNGTRYKSRLFYGLWLIAFMSTAIFLMSGIDIHAPFIFAAAVLGVLSSIPIGWRNIVLLKQRLDGHVLRYRQEELKVPLGVVIIVVPLGIVLASIDSFTQFSAMTYVIVAMLPSWLLATLYQIFWITALEHKLGRKVIEQTPSPMLERSPRET